MTKKYFDGIVPTPGAEEGPDAELKATAEKAKAASFDLMNDYHLADALAEIFTLFSRANKYIDETMPWVLAKDEANRARLGTVLYNLLEAVRYGAVLLTPFIPDTSDKIFKQLGTDKTDYASVSSFGALESGKPLGEAFTLFARIDEAKFLAEIEAKQKAAEQNASKQIEEPEHEPEIKIDAFKGIELRSAEILTCEPVPKAKKLYKIEVDLGYERRQIVSGIAKYYQPADLIGKKVIVVANLAPATLCGVESKGMLLASGEEDVRVVFLDPETPNGERIH